MLFPDLANKIVREVRRLIKENIIIINIHGVIIASTDIERIGQFHTRFYALQTSFIFFC
ncbi:sugar diacid recognition domain-containing protein, partial [Bacillus sp. B-TM1]